MNTSSERPYTIIRRKVKNLVKVLWQILLHDFRKVPKATDRK